ncbi:MAG: 30S ribosomal protein S13 [Promethearchaeota archaeon]
MVKDNNNIFHEKVFFRQLRSQVDGNAKIEYGLTQIRGVGRKFAQAIITVAGIDPSLRIGAIPEKDLDRIEEIILNPVENGIPNWMVNRSKDLRTGEDLHVIGNKLDLSLKNDIDRMKTIKSYKSGHHSLRLKVRGIRQHLFLKYRKELKPFVKKILNLMRIRGSSEIAIGYQYISELLDSKFLEGKELSNYAVEYLKIWSIHVSYEEYFIKFRLDEN